MTEAKTKSVKMTYSALYSYILNTYYRSFSGILGVLLSVMALFVLVYCWGQLTTSQRVVFILVAITFTLLNPFMLAFKAFKQLKLSPSYKKPLDYTFHDDGIKISQGELSQDITWNKICRILMTDRMLAIYTGRMHAFVIPLSELGSDKGKIIASVVQFTAEYKPAMSKNLKGYQSGKGL